MFKGILHARVDGGKLLLSRDGRQIDEELDATVCHLRGTSTELIARTVSEFETAWQVGEEKVSVDLYVKQTNYIDIPTLRPINVMETAKTRFSISDNLSLGTDKVYGFQGDRFLGPAGSILLRVASADETRTAVGFHGPDDGASEAASLHISVNLEHELFQSTFKPLWLGNRTATIDVIVGVCGFGRGSMAAVGDFEDVPGFVMASGVWSAELKSVMLSTISSAPERR